MPIKNGTAQIQFDERGVFCASESFIASVSNSETAETQDGVPILVVDGPWDENGHSRHGYAMYGGDTLGVGGHTVFNPGEDATFSMFWVGDIEYAFKAHAKTGAAYPDDENAFLVDRFGFKAIQP